MTAYPISWNASYLLMNSVIPPGWWASDIFSDHYPTRYGRTYRVFYCAAAQRRVRCCAPVRCDQQCQYYDSHCFNKSFPVT